MIAAISFTEAFVAHLAREGIGMVPQGVEVLHGDTSLEPPSSLFGVKFAATRVEVGAFTYFGDTGLFANASIGRYCSVGAGLRVGATQHPAHWLSTSPIGYMRFQHFEDFFEDRNSGWSRALNCSIYNNSRLTCIGNDVWIGADVYISDGVCVGDGAVIGAHSVVTHDVPPYAVVAGVPARLLRYRFSDVIIKRLLELQWWRFNALEFNGLDFSRPEASLEILSDAISQGRYVPYGPKKVNLIAEAQVFNCVLTGHSG